jgi:hypothetical protein
MVVVGGTGARFNSYVSDLKGYILCYILGFTLVGAGKL